MNSHIRRNPRPARRAMVKITVDAIDMAADLGPGQTIAALMFAATQVAREAGYTRPEMQYWCAKAMEFYEIGAPE